MSSNLLIVKISRIEGLMQVKSVVIHSPPLDVEVWEAVAPKLFSTPPPLQTNLSTGHHSIAGRIGRVVVRTNSCLDLPCTWIDARLICRNSKPLRRHGVEVWRVEYQFTGCLLIT
ncbi:hypothetical protein TNCV_1723311 [Trichonephila clavipes]|nr:hypothetical protein TNCV_1723311 [Trichonephila clavipes]